tara:strand:- start:6421 stop:7923 length:1503 start_codon:yes stop_codon:yes gene_type:complete
MFETHQERQAREEREEQERVLNENIQYAAFFDALQEIFGNAQELVPGDFEDTEVQTSKFNNILENGKLKNLQKKIAAHQGKPLIGLYAMIMQKKEVTQGDNPLPAPHGGKSAWGRALGALRAAPGAIVEGSRSLNSGIVDLLSGGQENSIDNQRSEALNLLNFPEYYVYIFSNIGDNTPPPTLLEERNTPLDPGQSRGNRIIGRNFTNLEAYQEAIVTSKAMRDEEDIAPGSIVRISYESPDTKSKVIINEVVENDPQFVELVLRSLGAKSALTAETACATDSTFRNTQHPTGDPIGTLSDVLTKTNIGGNNTIAYPFKENAEVNLVVILHGTSPYPRNAGGRTGQEIILSIVKEFDITSTMFLIPRGTDLGIFKWSAIKQAIDDLTNQGITISSKRLAAWSNGAYGFVNSIEGAGLSYWDRGVFLADPTPSPRSIWGTDFTKVPSGVYMEYNPANWGSQQLRDDFPSMVEKITSTGGQAILKEESHSAILKSILNKLNT